MDNKKSEKQTFLEKVNVKIFYFIIAVLLFIQLLFIIIYTVLPITDKGGLIGGIFSGLATAFTIVITITYYKNRDVENDNHQQERDRLHNKPWLSAYYKPKEQIVINELDRNYQYFSIIFEDINNDTLLPYVKFDEIPEEVLYSRDTKSSRKVFKISIDKFYVLEYTISNVGANNAVNIELNINEMPCRTFSLYKNQDIMIYLCVGIKNLKDQKDLNITVTYNDINSKHYYRQNGKIGVLPNKNMPCLIYSGQLSKPELLEEHLDVQ